MSATLTRWTLRSLVIAVLVVLILMNS